MITVDFPNDPKIIDKKLALLSLREIENTKKSLTVKAKEIRNELRELKKNES